MLRIGFIFCLVLFACKNKKSSDKGGNGFSYERFAELFKTITPFYQLSDTGLINNRDTTGIRVAEFTGFIPDSLKAKLFGKGTKVKYTALARMKPSSETSLYLIKGTASNKKAALLLAFDQDRFSAVMPFLVPDSDPATSQVSAIDKSYGITKTITKRLPANNIAEGKDVYVYEPGRFSLVLTNPIGGSSEVINPIDTFSRKHKFAGDYVKDKKNFVSVRDGRYPNQLLIFLHIDKNEGGCTGELKGDLLLTSSTTAIYRQGGDPCVLSFKFGSSSVQIKEDEGCGSHRGVDCTFDGTYNRKKEQKQKSSPKRTVKK